MTCWAALPPDGPLPGSATRLSGHAAGDIDSRESCSEPARDIVRRFVFGAGGGPG
jgi:hypothetical protein